MRVYCLGSYLHIHIYTGGCSLIQYERTYIVVGAGECQLFYGVTEVQRLPNLCHFPTGGVYYQNQLFLVYPISIGMLNLTLFQNTAVALLLYIYIYSLVYKYIYIYIYLVYTTIRTSLLLTSTFGMPWHSSALSGSCSSITHFE